MLGMSGRKIPLAMFPLAGIAKKIFGGNFALFR